LDLSEAVAQDSLDGQSFKVPVDDRRKFAPRQRQRIPATSAASALV